MTRCLPIFALAACLANALPAAAQEPPVSSPWSVAQQEVIDAASRGPVGIERDFDGWAGGYHADWSYWRLGTDSTRPRDEHLRLVRDYVGAGNIPTGFELEPVDVVIHGDTALLRYNAVETLEEADGGVRQARFSSASLYVREGGRWVCLATNIFYPPEGE